MILETSSQTTLRSLRITVKVIAFKRNVVFIISYQNSTWGDRRISQCFRKSYNGPSVWLLKIMAYTIPEIIKCIRLNRKLFCWPAVIQPMMKIDWMTTVRANWFTIPSGDSSFWNVMFRSTPRSSRKVLPSKLLSTEDNSLPTILNMVKLSWNMLS